MCARAARSTRVPRSRGAEAEGARRGRAAVRSSLRVVSTSPVAAISAWPNPTAFAASIAAWSVAASSPGEVHARAVRHADAVAPSPRHRERSQDGGRDLGDAIEAAGAPHVL